MVVYCVNCGIGLRDGFFFPDKIYQFKDGSYCAGCARRKKILNLKQDKNKKGDQAEEEVLGGLLDL